MVAADPGDVAVDDARAGTAAELDPLGGGDLRGRRRRRRRAAGAAGTRPSAPGSLALPRGGVEVELEPPAAGRPGRPRRRPCRRRAAAARADRTARRSRSAASGAASRPAPPQRSARGTPARPGARAARTRRPRRRWRWRRLPRSRPARPSAPRGGNGHGCSLCPPARAGPRPERGLRPGRWRAGAAARCCRRHRWGRRCCRRLGRRRCPAGSDWRWVRVAWPAARAAGWPRQAAARDGRDVRRAGLLRRRGGRGVRRRGMSVAVRRGCFFGAAGCAGGPPDEPHAASVTASAAAGSASSIRGMAAERCQPGNSLVIVSPCGAAGCRPGAFRVDRARGQAGRPAISSDDAASAAWCHRGQPPTSCPAGRNRGLPATSNRLGRAAGSGPPPAGPIGVDRRPAQPAVRHRWCRLSLPRPAGACRGLLLAGRAVGRLPG